MPSSQTAGIVHWSKGMKGIGIVVGMQVGVIGLKVLHNYVINNVNLLRLYR